MGWIETAAAAENLALGRDTLVSLFGDGQLDAVTPGQGDVGLGAFADHEDVAQSGSESVTHGVLKIYTFTLE